MIMNNPEFETFDPVSEEPRQVVMQQNQKENEQFFRMMFKWGCVVPVATIAFASAFALVCYGLSFWR